MIYRDESGAVTALRREIAVLGRHPAVAANARLRQALGRARRRVDRQARALARIEVRGLAIAPRSLTELLVACALSFAGVTVALGLVLLILMIATSL